MGGSPNISKNIICCFRNKDWMKTLLWTILILLIGTVIFAALFFRSNDLTFDHLCKPGKVCTLYPHQIQNVISQGKDIVMFFYSPSCDTSQKIRPMLERLCTRVNDVVFCQINCGNNTPSSDNTNTPPPGTIQTYHEKNMIAETSQPGDVEKMIQTLRLQ